MTPEKLTALRAPYADAGGADIGDPDFSKAAGLQFSDGERALLSPRPATCADQSRRARCPPN